MDYFKISGVILDACITVHKVMGPSLQKSFILFMKFKSFHI
jgi:hypothetical protein